MSEDGPDVVGPDRTAQPEDPLPPDSASEADQSQPRPSLGAGVLALAGLSSLAFAQPVYDLLRRAPEFFAVRNLYMGDLLALVVLLAVAPTLVLSAPAITARFLRPAWTRPAVAAPLGLLAAVVTLQAVGALPVALALAVPPAVGAAVAWAYVRFPGVRAFALILSVAALVVPAILVLDSRIRRSAAAPSHTIPIVAADTGARAPIILVVFDEWSLTSILDSEGAIDRRRLPNLARLADQATWYPNATSAADSTTLSVTSILTGSKPEQDWLPTVAEHPVNLFTELAPSHDLYALEPITLLCPQDLNLLATPRPPPLERLNRLVSDLSLVWLSLTLPEHWAQYLPPVTQTWSGFGRSLPAAPPPTPGDQAFHRAIAHLRQADRAAVFRRFIDSIGPSDDRPSLHFIHSMLPHVPYEYLPSGKTYPFARRPVHGFRNERWSSEWWPIQNQRQRYLLQVGFVDRLLGELISRLESTGRFDQSLIAITADHGLSFLPGRSRRVVELDDPSGDHSLDIAAVPLLVKAPFQHQARIDDAPLSLVDLTPRLLQIAGGRAGLSAGKQRGERPMLVGRKSGTFELTTDRGPWRRTRLAEQATLLGDSDDPLAIGARPDLHGRKVSELPYRQSDLGIRLEAAELWDNVDLDRPMLPVVVEGFFDEPEQAIDRTVAVAMNGVIAATVRSYSSAGGQGRISATMTEAQFRPGLNHLDVFLVPERDRELTLEQVQRPHRFTYELSWDEERSDHTLLRRSGTSPYDDVGQVRVAGRSAGILGYLQQGHLPEAEIRGWTVDLQQPGSVEEVVAFLDRRPYWVGPIIFERSPVAERYGPEHLQSGFLRTGWPTDETGSQHTAEALDAIRRKGVVAYAISRRGLATRLRFRFESLERKLDGVEILPISDGRHLIVRPPGGGFGGQVDLVARSENRTLVEGWAADLEQAERPGRIVVYRDGEYLTSLIINRKRPDVAGRFKERRLLDTGFRGPIPGAPEPETFAEHHRVFAVMSRGAAVELPIRAELPAGE